LDLSAGIDLVSVARIEAMLARWGERFLKRIYTDGEIAYCMSKASPAPSLAARFAAKEAFFKAVSAARAGAVSHKHIEVVVDDGGRPAIRAHGSARRALGGRASSLSLSHEEDLAVAVVVACGVAGAGRGVARVRGADAFTATGPDVEAGR
jgi:holo-[acyl-carrier protein] synthase